MPWIQIEYLHNIGIKNVVYIQKHIKVQALGKRNWKNSRKWPRYWSNEAHTLNMICHRCWLPNTEGNDRARSASVLRSVI
jgi:hypothetical protein